MISKQNYQLARRWIKDLTGVELGDTRQVLVNSRLNKRVLVNDLTSVDEYIIYLSSLTEQKHHKEWQYFVDLLTTHETYFYREAAHFDFLNQIIFPEYKSKPLKILSAACSSGEELYTVAFELLEKFNAHNNWSLYGFDIAHESIQQAKNGVYDEVRTKLVPHHIRKKYLLKGINSAQGKSQVKDVVRKQMTFFTGNMLEPIKYKPFDVIFCRNVLIYFDTETKQKVIEQLMSSLNPGGYLIVSQTEQLRQFVARDNLINSSIARKPQ